MLQCEETDGLEKPHVGCQGVHARQCIARPWQNQAGSARLPMFLQVSPASLENQEIGLDDNLEEIPKSNES